MKPVNLLIVLSLLFLVTLSEAGKKNSVHKIIIHVPYKIHKHHHTHTKYKLITIPTPKKENTVIYLTEEKKPEISLPHIQTQETNFIPPHQQSASGLLSSLASHNTKDSVMEAQEISTTLHHEPQNVQMTHGKDFIPSLPYNPHKFSYKPMIHETFTPKLLPFHFQPMILPHQSAFIPQYSLQPIMPMMQDNIAHSNNHVYKSVIKPNPTYKVKEEVQEHPNLRFAKRKPHSLNHFHKKVPSSKYHYKNLMKSILPSDEEYEHVGYLIIDGNSRKIVGKNFKDEIKLTR